MPAIDAKRLIETVNADPEFRLAARHLNATVGLNFEPDNLLLTFKDGALVGAATGNVASASIRMSASEKGWLEFLRPVPKPFYQGMLPAASRQGFGIEGDVESWTAYYGALRRVFAMMRRVITERD